MAFSGQIEIRYSGQDKSPGFYSKQNNNDDDDDNNNKKKILLLTGHYYTIDD